MQVKSREKFFTISALTIIVLAALLLVFKNQIFADTQSSVGCKSDHPYTVKSGKQVYLDGWTEKETGFPGVPKDYLIRIPREEVKSELGIYADNKTIVCSKSGNRLIQIPSFQESGEVFFQVQGDIAQNAEQTYYISRITNESQKLNLVRPSDIEVHPFRTESQFISPAPPSDRIYWTKSFWQGKASADFSIVPYISPGGNDTLKVNNFKGTTDITKTDWSTLLMSKQMSYDPAVNQDKKDTYYIPMGWVKFSNIIIPREEGGISSQGTRYYARVSDNTTDQYKNYLYVSDSVNTDWERYFAPIIFRDKKINTSMQSSTQNLPSGEIYYSSFKFIKNIKAPRQLKKTVRINNKDAEIEWQSNISSYFGSNIIIPRNTVNYQGNSFRVDRSTKLFFTNNHSAYYKDHYDGDQLIIASKLKKNLKEKNNFDIKDDELKNFKAEKSIIIGDLANDEFKNFAFKLRPDIKNLEFRKEGFRIFVSENYILAVGGDMAGSYYASLRLADLFSMQNTISPRMEEDYPSNEFRSLYSWNYTQKEHNAQVIKDDIRKVSALRYNYYPINGPREFEYMDSSHDVNGRNPQREMMIELFSYSRKYFVEPVVSSFSFGFFYSENNRTLVYKTREVEVPVDTKTLEIAKNITRKYTDDSRTGNLPEDQLPSIPFIVQNKDKTKSYVENSDYVLEYRDIDPTNPSLGKSNFINILPNSSITPDGNRYILNLTFNGNDTRSKSSRLSSKEAREFATKGIDNAIKYLHPKYIHINNDEITGVGMDYRDIYNPDGSLTGKSPGDLYADLINYLYNQIKTRDNSIKVIMWSDMINPYQHAGWNYSSNPKPYTFSAVDKIPKDIILDEWYLVLGDQVGCQQMVKAINYHLEKGFKVILGPTMGISDSTYRCFINLASREKDKILGFNIPQWTEVKDDKVGGELRSKQIWNYQAPTSSSSSNEPVWYPEAFTGNITYRFNPGLNIIGSGIVQNITAGQITSGTSLTIRGYNPITKQWVTNPGSNFSLTNGTAYYVENPTNQVITKTITGSMVTSATSNPRLFRDANFLFNDTQRELKLAQIKVDIYDGNNCLVKNVTLDQLKDSEYIVKRPYLINETTQIKTPTLQEASSAQGIISSIPSKKAYWIFVKNNITKILSDPKFKNNLCN